MQFAGPLRMAKNKFLERVRARMGKLAAKQIAARSIDAVSYAAKLSEIQGNALPIVTDAIAGVDCPLCEEGEPHEHGPLDDSVLFGAKDLMIAGTPSAVVRGTVTDAPTQPVLAKLTPLEQQTFDPPKAGAVRHCSRCGSTEHTKAKCTVSDEDIELEKLTAPDAKP